MKNKLVLVKSQATTKNNQFQFKEDQENITENKENKTKNLKENIDNKKNENKKKEEEKLEILSEVKIVETSSMEELSVILCFIFLYFYK